MPDEHGRPLEIGLPRNPLGEPKGPEIGAGTPLIRKRTLSLVTARDTPTRFDFAGRWLWARDSAGQNSNCEVFFNDPGGESVVFTRGLKVNYPFHRVYIVNTAQAAASLTFHMSMQPMDIENSSPQVTSTLTVPQTPAQAVVAVGVAAVIISAAALGTKRRIKVQAARANTDLIYLGGSTVTTANGYGELGPGDSDEIELEGALYAISGTAAQAVRVLDLNL